MANPNKPINLAEEVNTLYTHKNRNLSMEKLMLQKKHEKEMAAQEGKEQGYYEAIRDVETMLERLKLK